MPDAGDGFAEADVGAMLTVLPGQRSLAGQNAQAVQQQRPPQRIRQVEKNLDMAYIGERVILQCPDLDTATLQLQAITLSTVFCTFTIKVRNNGFDWVNHPSTVTMSASGISAAFSVTGYDEVCAEITSVSGPAAGRAMVTLTGRSTT